MISTKNVTAGAGCGNHPDAGSSVSTPAVTPSLLPAPPGRSSSPAAEGDARQRPSAADIARIHQEARDAAAEVAYPPDNYGVRVGRVWGMSTPVVIHGAGKRVDMSWNDGTGLCVGNNPDLWFPGRGDQSAIEAKRVCLSGCPLLEPCREHGIEHEPHFGVWGGLSVKERDAIRRQRRERAS